MKVLSGCLASKARNRPTLIGVRAGRWGGESVLAGGPEHSGLLCVWAARRRLSGAFGGGLRATGRGVTSLTAQTDVRTDALTARAAAKVVVAANFTAVVNDLSRAAC